MTRRALFLTSLTLLFLPTCFSAPQETAAVDLSGTVSQAPREAEGQERLKKVQEGVSRYVELLMDRYLDYLATPSTTTKLAKFQKSHFDALREAGFTEDQAIRIVISAGNPLTGFQAILPPQ